MPKQNKNRAQSAGELRKKQANYQKLCMKIAKISLVQHDPSEVFTALLGVGHFVIQTIPQREVREGLVIEAVQAFAASLGAHHGLGPSKR